MAATVTPIPLRGTKLTLSVGLVSVPVAMKPLAETQRPIPGKGLCPVHGPTLNMPEYAICCKGTAQEHKVAKEEKLTGYPHPHDPTRFVAVDPNVVKALKEPRDGQAAIEQMVDVASIDPGYLGKAYVVWPQAGGEQVYDLLAAVLKDGKAAVVTTVISAQTQTVLFRWSEEFGCVTAHVVEFESKIRRSDAHIVAAAIAERPEPEKKMLAMARTLFADLEGEFEPGEVVDRITPAMNEAIIAADEGKTFEVVQATETAPAGVDLMAALAASVATAKPKAPARRQKVAA